MAPVQLYVYDLSRGMAAQLSRQLTGQYIEGIWHTSIIFHGREWWYGQGINSSLPGRSHLGQPLKVVDLGESGIDEDIFREYIEEIRTVYTADKYHLLEFNCNSFTNDVAGFLTGGSIPAYIKDLPSDFLNTPLGAALRPTIDQMFRGPTAGRPIPAAGPDSSLLQDVASRATNVPVSVNGAAATKTLTAPIQICSNPSAFTTILERHKAVVAFFTSQTCAPCKMVEPTFEELAHAKATPRVAFVKIDMSIGMGGMVGEGFQVRATPTFLFFMDGKKVHELRGVDAPELRTQVNLLLYDAFPPHPHAKLNLPALRGVSLNPILFNQLPKFEALSTKLLSIINSLPANSPNDQAVISQQMIPYLQAKLATPPKPSNLDNELSNRIPEWIDTTDRLAKQIPPASLFPLVDLWRLAVLLPNVTSIISLRPSSIPSLLKVAADSVSSADAKNLVLTALRLACNIFANPALVRQTLSNSQPAGSTPSRDIVTNLLVHSLLSDAPNVRVAAASLAFNISAFLQTPLTESFKKGKTSKDELVKDDVVDDSDWEMEILSAVVEGISREDNEDSLHRLVTCLGLLVHLSPHLEEIRSLLEVLQVKETLQGKLNQKGLIQKAPVRKLVTEIADDLC